jgi:hypothetical protein
VIYRDGAAVIDWNVNWDTRRIATEMTIDLICSPFEYRAGEVFKLYGFGPATTGSTAKLPGRWLIAEVSRSRYSLASSFTLRQPEAPAPEPAAETGERGDAIAGDPTELVDICKKFTGSYLYGGGHGPPLSSLDFGDRLDCSSSTSLALKKAGMFPGSTAITSGIFASSWGEPGKGDDFTVYANAGHVFIQGDGWRFDTGGPGGGSGPRYHDQTRPTAGFTARRWKS